MTTLVDIDAYYQCDLEQNGSRISGWIEKRGAKIGANVVVKGELGLWHVIRVYHPPRSFVQLCEKQRRDRGGLKSIR